MPLQVHNDKRFMNFNRHAFNYNLNSLEVFCVRMNTAARFELKW